MNSVHETSDTPTAKVLIFTRLGRRPGGPASLRVSPRNLPHPRSVHETSDMSRHRKWLNLFKSHPVASLRNLHNRQLSVCEVSWTGLQVLWTGARMHGLGTRNLEHAAANALISRDQVAATAFRLVCGSVQETSHIRSQSRKPGTRRVIATG